MGAGGSTVGDGAGQLLSGRHIGTHTLWHGYARHLLMNGIPLNYRSQRLGLADIKVTLCPPTRHSYARHLLMNGIPLNYLSRWLGHSDIKTTLIYLELVPDPTGSLATVP